MEMVRGYLLSPRVRFELLVRMFHQIVKGLRTVGILLLLLLAGAAVAEIPAMRAVDFFVARHQVALFGTAIVVRARGAETREF
jgi:hypothetical protein